MTFCANAVFSRGNPRGVLGMFVPNEVENEFLSDVQLGESHWNRKQLPVSG